MKSVILPVFMVAANQALRAMVLRLAQTSHELSALARNFGDVSACD
jgi:hypothetical protein